MPLSNLRAFCAILFLFAASLSSAQTLPATAGETLSGKTIVLSDVLRGHVAVLVAGFSRGGGNRTGEWMKAVHADPAFANVAVYQIAMIAGAPKFIRGLVKSGMKKGVSPADQDHFVVLTDDEQPWKAFFHVCDDSAPYVALLNAQGKVMWLGHGAAAQFEPQLKAALNP